MDNEDSEEVERRSSLQRVCCIALPSHDRVSLSSRIMAVLPASGGLAGPDERRARRREESLAIPRAYFVDFNFGDSIHCRLCRAIVVGEVEPQPQTHVPAFGVIPW